MKSIYYQSFPVRQRNAEINIIRGERGNGKTTRFLRDHIINYANTGKKFFWLRRYKTEISPLFRGSFFDNVKKIAMLDKSDMKPDERDFIRNMSGELRQNQIFINKKCAGYYYALSEWLKIKSIPFPDVDELTFDEGILKQPSNIHYLSNEVEAFLEVLSTVFRDRKIRANIIGNSYSWTDPYSLYYNILPTNREFTYYNNKKILLQVTDNSDFRKHMLGTSFGGLVQGSKYGEYALNNVALDDNLNFVEKPPGRLIFSFGVRYKNKIVGFWLDKFNGVMYVTRNADMTSHNMFALTPDDHTLNTFLVVNKSSLFVLRQLKMFWTSGAIRFADIQLKKDAIDVLNILT